MEIKRGLYLSSGSGIKILSFNFNVSFYSSRGKKIQHGRILKRRKKLKILPKKPDRVRVYGS